MNVLSILSIAVYAAEVVVSPIPDEVPVPIVEVTTPAVSFGTLSQLTPPPEVLGASIEPTPTPQPTLRLAQAHSGQTRKDSFTIAVIGDSMVDTLGPDIAGLGNKLTQQYQNVTFRLLNYGVGATNIDYGITRLTSGYDYLGQPKPSLVSQNPDIVVIESFAYNPYSFDEGALDRHWLALAKAVDTVRGTLPEATVIIAATIAPNWDVFGDGAPGVSFSDQGKREHVAVVKRYLENALRFAQSQGLPLADVYHPSLQSDGNGKIQYINGGDHIHYSEVGRDLFARVLANTIVANKLLE